MTDTVVHLSGAALRRAELAAPFYRASIADGTRRALDELPDNLLKDIGLARDDVPFVAGELAFPRGDSTADPSRRTLVGPGAAECPQHRGIRGILGFAAGVVVGILMFIVIEL
jgi:hypothetical protein